MTTVAEEAVQDADRTVEQRAWSIVHKYGPAWHNDYSRQYPNSAVSSQRLRDEMAHYCVSAVLQAADAAKDLHRQLRSTAAEHIRFPADIPADLRPYFFALELCGEVGEVANQLKKQWRGDPGDFVTRAREELRDAQCIILFLAEMLGEDVLVNALSNMLEFEKSEKWRNMLANAEKMSRCRSPADVEEMRRGIRAAAELLENGATPEAIANLLKLAAE